MSLVPLYTICSSSFIRASIVSPLATAISDRGSFLSTLWIIYSFNPEFDPVDFTTKSSGLGTGLGLAISQKIIDSHHGKIHVQSEFGHGTEFEIIIPIS